ncbi:MAG: cofactor-independent phosphoglycerate mutase [Bacillota bacterium]|nr:cofactor-independent phosphoglycerate mutase [Bacillota bacterium]
MKYVVILGDGMADYPVRELGNKTPLQVAHKPNMDYLASHGRSGLVKTIPEGMPPGSDTANLSVMGYDPELYYSGRSPLEAVSMGIDLTERDVTFRCNLVTLSGAQNFEDAVMVDYSAGEISTAEASELIEYLNGKFQTESIRLYPGISYRHCLVLKNGKTGGYHTPPHDISDRLVGEYLPTGENSELLIDLMKRSRELLSEHPVNVSRMKRGLPPANSIWLWGEGRKPKLSPFEDKYGVSGTVISAVDLIKGIGICAGLKTVEVPGATGNIQTNFEGKADAAVDALLNKGSDFVYVHIEAPDECGHRYEIGNKVRAIELIDHKVVGPIKQALDNAREDYNMMVLPDHPTPLSLRTHTSDPVPFLLFQSANQFTSGVTRYDEESAKKSGVFIPKGCMLLDLLIQD